MQSAPSVHILLPPSTCLHPSLLLKSMIGQKSTNQGRKNPPEEPCSATLNTIPCRITSFHLHSPAICMCFALQSGLCNVHCKAGEYEQSAHPQYLTYRVAGRGLCIPAHHCPASERACTSTHQHSPPAATLKNSPEFRFYPLQSALILRRILFFLYQTQPYQLFLMLAFRHKFNGQ